MKPYHTLARRAADEVTIRKSRFIGQAAPVTTEEAALAFLGEIRKLHKDASHNCYAYVVGPNAGIMRYSDDGEPGGTAGLPMMEVLKARQVVDCCVVVTRYFGGILLGAGGLARAYTQGCALALDAAQVVVMEPSCRYLCEVAYPLWDRVQYALKSLPCRLESSDYSATVNFSLLMREQDEPSVLAALTAVTDSRMDFLKEESFYAPWQEADPGR